MDTRVLLMAFPATHSQTAARSHLELARLPADACLDLHYRTQGTNDILLECSTRIF
jgi:hypothetical protein